MRALIKSSLVILFIPFSIFGQNNDNKSTYHLDSISDRSGAVSTDTYAQYKINKTIYDYRDYTHEKSDLYNPTINGALSFVIPGSGHIIVGEYRRGFTLLGAAAGCLSLFPIGYNIAQNNYDFGRIIVFTGLAGLLAIDICSLIDAMRVVKVNNLAWREKNYTGYNIKLEPFLLPVQKGSFTGIQRGLSLSMYF